jgi:hypothetical protein
VDIKKAAVAVKLDPKVISVVKKPAVEHKAFKVLDPQTKKEVPANTMLTLPGGKQVQAGEYYAELNKLEKKLNEMGHSLRDQAKKVVLHQSTIKKEQLEAKAKKLAANHKAFDSSKMKAFKTRDELIKSFKADKGLLKGVKGKDSKDGKKADATKTGSRAAGKGSSIVKQWGWELGRHNLVATYLNARLELKGDKTAVTALGEANAGGWLVNHDIKILQGQASVRAPEKGQSTARLNIKVMGNTVFNLDKSMQTEWHKSDVLQKTFDYPTKFHFMLGPIPVSVTMGAQGTVGLRYFIGMRPLQATAQVTPFVHARAYAQAGIDIIVASAGVGGQLRLMDFELRITASLKAGIENSKVYLEEELSMYSDVTLLSGSLYLYASVTVPRFGIPPWKKKEYHWDIWKWQGFKKKGYIFNYHNKNYL